MEGYKKISEDIEEFDCEEDFEEDAKWNENYPQWVIIDSILYKKL